MKTVWSAKVHKSGDRVQLLKNGSVTKVIKASEETFVPAEAQKFASGLVSKLNARVAKQMSDPSAQPSVTSEGEQQRVDMKNVTQDAKGISPKEASLRAENAQLRKKIAHVEKSAAIERKARRGLAIAKALVDQKKIANTEAAVKAEVAKIAAMSGDEITLLERKVAGQKLYDTANDAIVASRRYARQARLHRQAAEDAEMANDSELADVEDCRAAHCEDLSKQAADSYAQFNNKPEAVTPEDISNQVKDAPKGVDAQGKKSSDETATKTATEEVVASDIDDTNEEELIDDVDGVDPDDIDDEIDDDIDVTAAAEIYRKIASNHKVAAEQLQTAGNAKDAATELEIAKEADELADSIEGEDSDAVDSEDFGKQAASIYRKIAADHRKKADDLEAEGKTDEADVEDEIADEAEQLASSVECDKPVEEVPAEAAPVEEQVAAVAKCSEEVAKPADEAVEDGNIELEAGKEETTEEDPLAALIDDDEKQAAEGSDEVVGDPTDDEIAAAVAGDNYDEEVEAASADVAKTSKVSKLSKTKVAADASDDDSLDLGDDKVAADSGTKKTANEGHSDRGDRLEQNKYANDPSVRELEEGLWSKD